MGELTPFVVSPQSTMYARGGELLSWNQYMLPKVARRYRVLNRNVWWNRRFVTIEAANDFEAIHMLLSVRSPSPEKP